MKLFLYIFVFSTLLNLSSFSQPRSFHDIIGIWEGADSDHGSGRLQIFDSTYVCLIIGADTTGRIPYKVDFAKTPIWFDFTVNKNGNEVTWFGLMQFTDDKTLRWQISWNKRITHFVKETDEIKTILLKRL